METFDEPEIKPGELRCPRCFGRDLVPSRPRGWRDMMMAWFGRIPRHCRACEKRFYIKKPSAISHQLIDGVTGPKSKDP